MVSAKFEIVNTNYDEDLQVNPFLLALKEKRNEVFNSAVRAGWIICIPQFGSFLKTEFDEDDFLTHVLVPFDNEEEKSQYKTLKNQIVNPSGRLLYTSKGFEHEKKVEILFDETFYLPNSKSFKVYCINEPLNCVADCNGYSSPRFVLDSVEDCTDLLWGHSGNKALQRKVDGLIHLYFHQLDNVHSRDLHSYVTRIAELHSRAFTEVSSDKFLRRAMEHDVLFENYLKLALEVYILNGLYTPLFQCITDVTAGQDALLNKVTRNWHDIRATKAGIRSEISENIPRSRRELVSIQRMTTPLGKCGCLKRMVTCLTSLRQSISQENIESNTLNSDTLLTILVFQIIKSDIPNWYAHLTFARNFRFARSTSDDEYDFLLTTLEAALEHICSLASKVAEYDSLTSDVADVPELVSRIDCGSVGELFSLIERGDVLAVKEAIRRGNKIAFGSAFGPPGIDRGGRQSQEGRSCHPLCQCKKCHTSPGNTKPGTGNKRERSITAPVLGSGVNSTVNVDSRDDRGWTGLHMASLHGQTTLVSTLLELGSCVDAIDLQGRTPLHLAAAQGHQDVIFLLLGSEADINHPDCEGYRPLHLAAERCHENCVKTLLYFGVANAKVDVNACDTRGNTALHLAANWGYESLVHLLLENDASPHIRNDRDQLPSEIASTARLSKLLQHASNHTPPSSPSLQETPPVLMRNDSSRGGRITSKLVEGGALSEDAYILIESSWTSAQPRATPVNPVQKKLNKMLKAAADGDLQMVRFYLGAATPDDEEEVDSTAVDTSVELCHPLCQCDKCLPIQKLTIAAHSGEVHVNSANSEGFTCLHLAAQNGHVFLTQYLLGRGACPLSATVKLGTTPLHSAAVCDHLEVLLLLIKSGSDVHCQDRQGNTPLHYAALKGHCQSVACLLQHGANVDARNHKGNTPLHEAVRFGHTGVTRFLLWQGAHPAVRNKQYMTPGHLAANDKVAQLIKSAMKSCGSVTTMNSPGPASLPAQTSSPGPPSPMSARKVHNLSASFIHPPPSSTSVIQDNGIDQSPVDLATEAHSWQVSSDSWPGSVPEHQVVMETKLSDSLIVSPPVYPISE